MIHREIVVFSECYSNIIKRCFLTQLLWRIFLPPNLCLPLDTRFQQNHILTLSCGWSHPNFSSCIGQVNLYRGSDLTWIALSSFPSAVFFNISIFVTYFYYLVFDTTPPASTGKLVLKWLPLAMLSKQSSLSPSWDGLGPHWWPDTPWRGRASPQIQAVGIHGTLNCQNLRRGNPQIPSVNYLENESLMNFLWRRRVTRNK